MLIFSAFEPDPLHIIIVPCRVYKREITSISGSRTLHRQYSGIQYETLQAIITVDSPPDHFSFRDLSSPAHMMIEMAFTTTSQQLPPSPLFSHPTKPLHRRTQSQIHVNIPSMKYMATRLQCVSNHKLNRESSRNEPRLRNLLGHISIYDSVREYRREQIISTSFSSEHMSRQQPQAQLHAPQQPQRQHRPQLQRQQSKQTASNDLQDYLNIDQARVPSFQDFQAAIELQLATLTEIQSTSRRLQALSQSCPSIAEGNESVETELDVEDYCSGSDSGSDYDSYDGEGDWRDKEDADSEDSMTDPESTRSERSSPVEEKEEDEVLGLVPLVNLIGSNISVDF